MNSHCQYFLELTGLIQKARPLQWRPNRPSPIKSSILANRKFENNYNCVKKNGFANCPLRNEVSVANILIWIIKNNNTITSKHIIIYALCKWRYKQVVNVRHLKIMQPDFPFTSTIIGRFPCSSISHDSTISSEPPLKVSGLKHFTKHADCSNKQESNFIVRM